MRNLHQWITHQDLITILHRIEKSIFFGNTEKPRVAKIIMNYKRTARGIAIRDLKLQETAIVIKIE